MGIQLDCNAFAFETPNWNPEGKGGTYDTSPTGVYYLSPSNVLVVFNENR